MGEADRLTVASGKTIVELMENAGKAVAQAIEKRWSARPVIVLCGPGNNGRDGFVTARYLSTTGWPVRLALLGSQDHLTGATRHHAELWCGKVEPLAGRSSTATRRRLWPPQVRGMS
jgi:NAD(P)H-hydrate epimerase